GRGARRSPWPWPAGAGGERLEGVLQRLLARAARRGVRPRLLLLDRGFCSVGVIRYLQAARRPFLMPLPLRGRPAGHPRGPSGSRVFGLRRRSGWGSYTLTANGGGGGAGAGGGAGRPPPGGGGAAAARGARAGRWG